MTISQRLELANFSLFGSEKVDFFSFIFTKCLKSLISHHYLLYYG